MPHREAVALPIIFTAQQISGTEGAVLDTVLKSGISGVVMIGAYIVIKHLESRREATTAEHIATLKAENARLQAVLDGKDATIEKLHSALAKRIGSDCNHEKPA